MKQNVDKSFLSKAILKSQHCQRNFDLDQNIPEEDIEILKTAATQCPSKQNVAFYKTHFIFDREIIEAIYETAEAIVLNSNPVRYRKKNPQVLANLLIVFEKSDIVDSDGKEKRGRAPYQQRNAETKALSEGTASPEQLRALERDANTAVGIAAGYLNLTASLLGYKTGCCSCFNDDKVKSILKVENKILLLMEIGFKDRSRIRTEHHLEKGYFIGTFKKQPIETKFYGQQKNQIEKTS